MLLPKDFGDLIIQIASALSGCYDSHKEALRSQTVSDIDDLQGLLHANLSMKVLADKRPTASLFCRPGEACYVRGSGVIGSFVSHFGGRAQANSVEVLLAIARS